MILVLPVDAHVRFHPEVPVLPLLRLVHLWVPALFAVLGRGRGVNQSRVHNRARRDPHPLGLQMQVHCPQNLFPQMVLFQQVPKLAHRRLIRRRLGSQINSHELPQGRRVVQSLFHRRVRQIEPLLQKINPQHRFPFFRPSPVARLGIVRLDQRTQFPPRYHLLHLFQEHCPSSLLRVPLESRHHCHCPLLAERVHAGTTLSILPVERENLIRVSLGNKETGARGALPIWMDFMAALPRLGPRHDFLPIPEESNRMLANEVTDLSPGHDEKKSPSKLSDERRFVSVDAAGKSGLDHSDASIAGVHKQ